jgi:hypothetical protein
MSDANTKAGRIDTENQKVATLPRPKPQLLAGNAGHAIVPQSVEACYRMAELIVKAGMAPKSVNTVEKATVAILHGLEVGLTPMAALQSIAVINGNPSIWGDGMLALIEASGLMEEFEESIEYDDKGEPQSATCTMKRVGRKPTVRMFTRPMAARAGLLKKDGPWQAYPHRMMQRRARWWCATDTFSDVLKGLSSAEERQDMVDITETASATTAEPRRADFQPAQAQQQAEPDQPEEEGWPLHDETGETVGRFGTVEWVGKFLDAYDKLQGAECAQFLENNQDAAKEIWSDADEETAKKLSAVYTPLTETETVKNWKSDALGEGPKMADIKKLIGEKAGTVGEVDDIMSQNAEFLAKLSAYKRDDINKTAAARKLALASLPA